MRLQRSPSGMVALESGDDSSYTYPPAATTRIELSPNAKNPTATLPSGHHRQSTLVGHYVHHARQPSSLTSVDLHSSPMITSEGFKDHKHATNAVEPEGAQRLYQPSQAGSQVRPGSFATQAYREFLASATASAASSAASSGVPSRQSSRASSGYNSQTISGQSSRTASPMSKREEREEGQIVGSSSSYGFQTKPIGNHASMNAAASAYLEAQFAQPTALQTTTTTITQQVSTLSFGNMLAKSDSQESLEEGGVTHERPQPRLRPNHFTFCEQDIMKSFMRAAERDRARAEREERAREAQQRVEMEQEHERRKQHQREQAARELSYQAQTARYETVGESFSHSDSSPDTAPVRRRRRFPPVPAHFKFSTHDVTKSAAKPSQRQNIGHWTSFPRSSTIMLPAEQLRSWIRTMIAEQQQAEKQQRRAAQAQQAQKELIRAKTSQQNSSAPSTPVSGLSNNRSGGSLQPVQAVGSSTARVTATGRSGVPAGVAAAGGLHRRASLPAVYDAVGSSSRQVVSHGPVKASHARSGSYSHVASGRVVPVEKNVLSSAADKTGLSTARRGSVDNALLSHRTSSGGGFERATSLQSLGSKPVKAAAHTATTAAIDAAARRAQALQARHGLISNGAGHSRGPHSLDFGMVSTSTASAPASMGNSPVRVQQPMQNGASSGASRTIKSTHVSPTRPDQRRLVSAGQQQPQQQQFVPQPPVGRKASLSGETKTASAHNSPQMHAGGRGLINGVDAQQSWQGAYGKSLNDVFSSTNGLPNQQTNGFQKPINQLYRDVQSSGYGQRVR